MLDRNVQFALTQLRKDFNKVLSELQVAINDTRRGVANATNVVHTLIRVLETIGIKEGWWANRDEFQELFAQQALELFKEATQHETAEMERIKEEQKSGANVVPMRKRETVENKLFEISDAVTHPNETNETKGDE